MPVSSHQGWVGSIRELFKMVFSSTGTLKSSTKLKITIYAKCTILCYVMFLDSITSTLSTKKN